MHDIKITNARTHNLKGINVSIPRNSLTVITGLSGSGKSSLMYCLSTLKTPTEGSIVYNGTDYRDMARGELERLRREQFGFVFQHHFLVGYMSAMDNVMVAAKEITIETKKRAEELLQQLRIKPTESKKKPKQLSGGQRQRCAIARALINEPKVLFADEPTGNLDPKNSWEIMKLLEQINKRGTTVIVVTHNREIVNAMQKRVVTMKKGVIVSDEQKGGYIDDED